MSERPAYFGPARNLTGTCRCGLQFADYKVHRETGFHKRYVREQKRKQRAERAAS